jgi:hypothetical protein
VLQLLCNIAMWRPLVADDLPQVLLNDIRASLAIHTIRAWQTAFGLTDAGCAASPLQGATRRAAAESRATLRAGLVKAQSSSQQLGTATAGDDTQPQLAGESYIIYSCKKFHTYSS